MYGITNFGKIFADDSTEWLLEAGLIQSPCKMSIFLNIHHTEQRLLFYLMLMTVSIGIILRLLENGLWIP